jgi:mannose-6-phosphate isomerase
MPKAFYPLENGVQHYSWGAPDWIPELLGLPADGRPWAEVWMGAHPLLPSGLRGESRSLPDLLQDEREWCLGSLDSLPFLFKVLAAAEPLSLQVHPDAAQAQAGFAGGRCQDPFHKPEMLLALTPFCALAGFRPLEERAALLQALPGKTREKFAPLLGCKDPRELLWRIFALDPEETRSLGAALAGLPGEAWELAAFFAGKYPEDPAFLAPVFLNLLNLKPGQAIFLPPGTAHSYIRGLGAEVMAASDNVLRGGLTGKSVDRLEFLRAIGATGPEILLPADGGFCRTYPQRAAEFALSALYGDGASRAFPLGGPAILLILEGEAGLAGPGCGNTGVLGRGESAFIPAGGSLSIAGKFRGLCASVGRSP